MAIRQVLKSEYASIFNDIVHPLYGGGRINVQDDVVLQRGQGKSWDIYDNVASDPHVYAVLQKRYNAVIARDWEVKAASDRRQDKKAADLVRAQLDALSARMLTEDKGNAIVSTAGGFDLTCYGLLEAIMKGFSVGEILWDTDGNETYPREIRIKNQRRFAFYAGDRGYQLRLLTTSRPYDGEPLPAKKFICHIFNPHKGPYGYGLGNKLFWPAWFKNSDIKFWLAFCDKYGMPTAVGKYPTGRNDIRDKLIEAIDAIAQETGIAIPQEASIDFLTAQHGGVTGAYKDLAEYMDREISKTVLGETGSTDQQAGGGSRARDQIGNEVRIEIAKGDADLLSDTLNRTLIKWIVEFNLPDAQPPTVWRKFPELAEDLDARTGRDKALLELGYRLKSDRAIQIYGDEYEPSAETEDAKPALVSTLGVGGTQSLLGFLQQGASAMPRDNAIAILTTVFGIQRSDAESMVPVPEKQAPGTQDQLNQIFGGGDASATEQPAPVQATAEATPPEQPTDQTATDQTTEQPAPDTANLAEQKSSQIQTILFPEDWEEDKVREWLKKHNFSTSKVVKEGNLWRSRQLAPSNKKEYRTITLDKENDIKAVIEFEEAIELTDAIASIFDPPVDFARLKLAGNTKQKKNCTKGWSCGFTCLPRTKKNCDNGIEGDAKTLTEWLERGAKKILIDNLKASSSDMERSLVSGRDEAGDRIDPETSSAITRQLKQVKQKMKDLGEPGIDPDATPRFNPFGKDLLTGSEKQTTWADDLRYVTYRSAMSQVKDLQRKGIEGISDVTNNDIRDIQAIATDLIAQKSDSRYWIDTRFSPESSKFVNEAARRHFETLAEQGDARVDASIRDRLIQLKQQREEYEAKKASREKAFKELNKPELNAVSAKQADYATKERDRAIDKAKQEGVTAEDLQLALDTHTSASWWLDTGRYRLKQEIQKLKSPERL